MNSYKILVIEDEKNICNFMKMILETGGYQPLFAGNGKNGLLMFYSHHPDLVILDLGLPDMDGMEVIEEIRKQSETPVIVLSARTGEQDKIEALDLGANDYITKPFGTGELLARVRASLRTNRFQGLEPKSLKHFKLYDLEINYDARKVDDRRGRGAADADRVQYCVPAFRMCRESAYLCRYYKKNMGLFRQWKRQKTSGQYGKHSEKIWRKTGRVPLHLK